MYISASDRCDRSDQRAILPSLGSEMPYSVRYGNKVGVPNADIMLPPNPQSNHLSPVKGELESR